MSAESPSNGWHRSARDLPGPAPASELSCRAPYRRHRRDYLEKLGYAVTRGVGVTGVVGVLQNGDGPTVMLRADMDALPMAEDTGLPYASTATATDADGQTVSLAHSCGHDLHVAWMLGAARVLAESRGAWRGTAMVVFQPGEETAQGASAMVADWERTGLPRPDVVLGQHVMVARQARWATGRA